jgi:hypothetical protein
MIVDGETGAGMFEHQMQVDRYQPIHWGKLLGISDQQFEVLVMVMSVSVAALWLWIGYRKKRKHRIEKERTAAKQQDG